MLYVLGDKVVKNRDLELLCFDYFLPKEVCLSLHTMEGNRFMYALKDILCHRGVLNRKYQQWVTRSRFFQQGYHQLDITKLVHVYLKHSMVCRNTEFMSSGRWRAFSSLN